MRRSLVIDPGLDKLQNWYSAWCQATKSPSRGRCKSAGWTKAQCDAVLDAMMKPA